MSLIGFPNRTAHSLFIALAGKVPAGTTPGLDRLLAEHVPASVLRGVAIFSDTPAADQVLALEQLGLTVQPMRHAPLADVTGTVGAMKAAVEQGIAIDVYLDERSEDTRSSVYRRRQAGWDAFPHVASVAV